MVTSVKPKKILGFDAPIIINLYICLRQGLQHVKPKLLTQNQPHLFSLSYFRSLPPDLPYHQSLTLVSSTVSPQNNMMSPSPSTPSTLTTAQPQGIKFSVLIPCGLFKFNWGSVISSISWQAGRTWSLFLL